MDLHLGGFEFGGKGLDNYGVGFIYSDEFCWTNKREIGLEFENILACQI